MDSSSSPCELPSGRDTDLSANFPLMYLWLESQVEKVTSNCPFKEVLPSIFRVIEQTLRIASFIKLPGNLCRIIVIYQISLLFRFIIPLIGLSLLSQNRVLHRQDRLQMIACQQYNRLYRHHSRTLYREVEFD